MLKHRKMPVKRLIRGTFIMNILNNSYTRALSSGIIVSTIALQKGSVPLSLSTPISMIIDRTISFLSHSITTRRESIDRNIATLTVPTTCIALATYHVINSKNSDIIDVAMAVSLLLALNKTLIQPAIEFIKPTKLLFNKLSAIKEIPIIQNYPTLQKLSISYFASLLTSHLLTNSSSASETSLIIPLCNKFALAVTLGFASRDLFSFFSPLTEKALLEPISITNSLAPIETVLIKEEPSLKIEITNDLVSIDKDKSKKEISVASILNEDETDITDRESTDEEDLDELFFDEDFTSPYQIKNQLFPSKIPL